MAKRSKLDYAIREHKKAKALFLELEKRKFSAVEALLI
jgi:low affinity Fe/Cu permease